jgi:hypothetical protein
VPDVVNPASTRNAPASEPVAVEIPVAPPAFNAEADVWAGVAEALRIISERKRAGGRGWPQGEQGRGSENDPD